MHELSLGRSDFVNPTDRENPNERLLKTNF